MVRSGAAQQPPPRGLGVLLLGAKGVVRKIKMSEIRRDPALVGCRSVGGTFRTAAAARREDFVPCPSGLEIRALFPQGSHFPTSDYPPTKIYFQKKIGKCYRSHPFS